MLHCSRSDSHVSIAGSELAMNPLISSAMPGTFAFDSPLMPKVDISVGARSHIFQPPSSACGSLQSSTESLASATQESVSTTSRKRNREDSHIAQQGSLCSTPSRGISSMPCDCPSPLTTSGLESPPPLTNLKYRLAGGLDTPTAKIGAEQDVWPLQDDLKQREALGRRIRGYDPTESDNYFPPMPSALAMERNGMPRMPRSPSIRDGLGNVIYRVAGVAGKVLQNWSNTFRGFYAGGGRGYDLKSLSESMNGEQNTFQTTKENGFWEMSIASTPGGFPLEDYIPDYMSQDHTKTPPRASKRTRCSSDMTASWVVVSSATTSREASPSRISHRKVPPSNTKRYAVPRGLNRRPILPASRPSLSSYTGPSTLQTASYASPRSHTSFSPSHSSPVSVEARRYEARLRKREAEEDANLKRFNQQLKAMIKEGKEALGTKFEVEEDETVVDGSEILLDQDCG